MQTTLAKAAQLYSRATGNNATHDQAIKAIAKVYGRTVARHLDTVLCEARARQEMELGH